MRKSLKKIFKRHEDGTEHEYDDEEGQSDGRPSSDNRRSMDRRSFDTSSTRRSQSRRRETKDQKSRLDDAPLAGATPAADDYIVSNVLRETRGQDGPVVRGMDKPDIVDIPPRHVRDDLGPRGTIRAVNNDDDDNNDGSERRGSHGSHNYISRKPVPPSKATRRSIDTGRRSIDDNPHFYESNVGPSALPSGETRGPQFYTTGNTEDTPNPYAVTAASTAMGVLETQRQNGRRGLDEDGLPDVSRRAIDTDQVNTDTTPSPTSPTAAFYGVPNRKPVRSSIDEGRNPNIVGGVLTHTPPRRSSLRNSFDASAVPNFATPYTSRPQSRDSTDSNRELRKVGDLSSPRPRSASRGEDGRSMASSLKKTGLNPPHGLMRIDSEDNRNSNMITNPPVSSSVSPGFANAGTTATTPPPADSVSATTATATSSITPSSLTSTSVENSTAEQSSSPNTPKFAAGYPLTFVGKDNASELPKTTRNVATFPNVATSTKQSNAPKLYNSPDIASIPQNASTDMATAGPTSTQKPNGTSAGWPIAAHTEDPVTTKITKGQGHSVADGPLAAAFAAKYSEPDKYSRHVHVHRAETKIAPAVVHETIQQKVFHNMTYQVERHIHHHDVYQHIQPIFHQERLPDRHWIRQEDGSLTEVSPSIVEILKLEDGYKEEDRFEEVINHRGESNLDPAKFKGGRPVGVPIGGRREA